MSKCGRCAGHGVIQGYRFDMESSPVESYREPCPECSEGPSYWVRCFFGCGFRARDLDPEEAHNHMEAHYEVSHREALEYLHAAGFIPSAECVLTYALRRVDHRGAVRPPDPNVGASEGVATSAGGSVSHSDLKQRAAEAVALWHENGLTLEFLEGMTYNHRVALFEVAREHLEGCLTPPTEEEVEAAAKAIMKKLREHPTPAPAFGGTAESAMYWGVSVEEVAKEALEAARRVRGDS